MPGCTVGDTGDIEGLVYSPDDTVLASSGGDGAVRVWDAAAGTPRLTLKGHGGEVDSVAFSPDGTSLATGGKDGLIRLWDVATGGETLSLSYIPHGALADLRFSDDGATLISLDSRGDKYCWQTNAK